MDETKKELRRLEKELMAEQPHEDDLDVILNDELLREIMAEDAKPAFEDPQKIHEPAEPMVYRNFSNDYGKDLEKKAEETEMAKKKKNDKLLIGLMITACALCLGIMGILIYWWEMFMG